jgi:phage-related protein
MTGEEAYKNLGLSQSDYLATANKMGALFQGSGIEQQKSLELTEKAMQRSADMASVMGIDMSMAMEAVTGAAKGNFTMMDNLGVAMNATNIEAYALAKGLDFTWKTATQAEKAEVAMQMFFENTQQYAGNFAKESTQTISGSIGLMQAALGSFTAGLGNANADMTNLTDNLANAFEAVVKNIVPVIENIVVALPTAMDAILSAISDLLPALLDTVTKLFTQMLETILSLLPEIIPAMAAAVMTIASALIENLPLLFDAAVQLVTELVEDIGLALPELIPAAVEAIVTIAQGLLNSMDEILEAAFAIIKGLAEGLLNALPQLIDALPQIITSITNFITENLPAIISMGMTITVQLAAGLIRAIPQLVANLPQIVYAIITGFGKAAVSIVEIGKNIVQGLWNGINSMTSWIKNKIKDFVGGIVNNVKGLLGIHSPSAVFASIGDNMAIGLGQGFDKSMSKVSEDIQNAIPTDFDINWANNIKNGGNEGATNNFNIASMVVRNNDDIKSIARELYLLQRRTDRGYAI